MRKLFTALFLAVATPAVAGCVTLPTPQNVANASTLDEKGGIAVEVAYTAAATAAALAIRTKMVDKATTDKIAALDIKAYDLVKKTRLAYDIGNATDYKIFEKQALSFISQIVGLLKGE